ncbi:MAG: PDZ domain-containing protein, partial [Polyangiales bacterium]
RLATALGGLPILGCLAGSPADGAGIRYGDILLSIDGMPTASWDDFVRARSRCAGQLRLRVFRQGTEFDVSVALRAAAKTPFEIVEELHERGVLTASAAADGVSRPPSA